MPPCLLRKNDGATLYATRDLAAAMYRWETYHPDRSLYVVDRGQSMHFKQLFTVLHKAGFPWWDRLTHVPFGLVRIAGKKATTRFGGATSLGVVLDEAVAKIDATIAEKNPSLSAERRAKIAHTVGVGAVVFGNLSTQRDKDVDFELDQITSFDGNSAPYIQYAHARTASVLKNAGAAAEPAALAAADPTKLTLAEEWALARLLHELPDVALRAAENLEPHHVSHYLLEVCAAYSRWYTLGNRDASLKTLTADVEVSRARLALTHATQKTLKLGLSLLGIGAPDEM
jgi:arginyl-tRNA synthetase